MDILGKRMVSWSIMVDILGKCAISWWISWVSVWYRGVSWWISWANVQYHGEYLGQRSMDLYKCRSNFSFRVQL